ncbi:MAG: ATP-binding protein [Lachnospiraceae bacterium]|jgi:signal transduction histidine kinase/PAS domain-containing protein|nr:ATP-binding protein [Lachnospiraceae bacterium]
MQTPIEFGKNFLVQYYTKRDIAESMACLSDEIIWIMPEKGYHLRGQKEIFAFLKGRIDTDPEKWYVDVARVMSDPSSDTTRTVLFELALVPLDPSRTRYVQASMVVRTTKKDMEITFLHISRTYDPSDPGPFHEFVDYLAGEVMIVQGIGPGEVRLVWQNHAFCRELGYTDEEYRTLSRSDPFFMLSVKSRSALTEKFGAPDRSARISLPARALCKDKTVKDYSLTGRFAYAQDGTAISFLLFQDVTEYADRDRRLTETVEAWKQVQDALPCQVVLLRIQPVFPGAVPGKPGTAGKDTAVVTGSYTCGIVRCSAGMPALFGLDREAYEQAVQKDIFAGFDFTNVRKDCLIRDHVTAQADDAETCCGTYTVNRADGTTLPLRLDLSGIRQNDGSLLACLCCTDVTPLREEEERVRSDCRALVAKAEEKQKAAEEKEAAAEAVIQAKADRRIEEITQKCEERIKAAEEHCAQQTEEVKRQAAEQVAAAQENARKQAAGAQEEADRRAAAAEAAADRRAGEAERKTSSFLAGVHGDMRNPPESVLALADRLDMEGHLNGEQKDALEKIREASRYMLQSVDHLMEISRPAAGEQQLHEDRFILADLMEELCSRTAAQCTERHITFAYTADPGLPEVLVGDSDVLGRVLSVLLDNAVKFTKSGGKVTLLVHAAATETDRLPLRFAVRDTGVGIEESLLPKVFDPFTKGSGQQGFGLGLAVASELVHRLGGSVGVNSTPGVGSEFTVSVTMQAPHNAIGQACSADELRSERRVAGRNGAAPAAGDAGLAGHCILVAEDDPLNSGILRDYLERRGIYWEKASGGQEAVSIFARDPADRYDAALIDYHMPGMDGLEAARRIREIEKARGQGRETPIIVMTAGPFEEDVAKSLSVFAGSLSKPPDPHALYDILAWAFDPSKGEEGK